MSYSSGQSARSDSFASDARNARRLDALVVVNGLLRQLSLDEDFHDRLQEPIVKKALNHWSGKNRLSSEESQMLNENYNVIHVFAKFRILQEAFNKAEFQIEFSLITDRKKHISLETVLKSFGGQEILSHPKFPYSDYNLVAPVTPVSNPATSASRSTNPSSATSPTNAGSSINSGTNLNDTSKNSEVNDKTNRISSEKKSAETQKEAVEGSKIPFQSILIQAVLAIVFSFLYVKYGTPMSSRPSYNTQNFTNSNISKYLRSSIT